MVIQLSAAHNSCFDKALDGRRGGRYKATTLVLEEEEEDSPIYATKVCKSFKYFCDFYNQKLYLWENVCCSVF